jgi:hypothetical protein
VGHADYSVGLRVELGALFHGSSTWTARRKHTSGVRRLAWKAYMSY